MRTSIFPFFMKPKCVAGHLLAQRQIMRMQGSQSRAFCRRATTRQRATRWQGADQSGQPGSMGFAAVVQFQPHWILARATVFSLFATLDIVITAFLPASSVMVLVGGSASKVTLSGSGVDAMVRVWRRGYASCQTLERTSKDEHAHARTSTRSGQTTLLQPCRRARKPGALGRELWCAPGRGLRRGAWLVYPFVVGLSSALP